MTSIYEFGRRPDHGLAVKTEESEKISRSLDDLVVRMKDAVAMVRLFWWPQFLHCFDLSSQQGKH